MPVTAKLSSAFYERLGDQIANELVSWLNAVDESVRHQLLELNDRNWERLRSQMDARDERLRAQADARDARIAAQFTGLEARLDAREARVLAVVDSSLAQHHSSLVRWMVGLWLSTTATTILTIVGLRLL